MSYNPTKTPVNSWSVKHTPTFKGNALEQQTGTPLALVVISSSLDAGTQNLYHNTESTLLENLGYKVINAGDKSAKENSGMVTFNGNILQIPEAVHLALAQARGQEIFFAYTGHGELLQLFDNPEIEDDAITKLASQILILEMRYGIKIKNVMLDACYSGSELKKYVPGLANESPARVLSKYLTNKHIYAINGVSTTNMDVTVVDNSCPSKQIMRYCYADNAIVFNNGDVIKGSKHKYAGEGMLAKITPGNTTHFNKTHGRILSPARDGSCLVRINSFSGLN